MSEPIGPGDLVECVSLRLNLMEFLRHPRRYMDGMSRLRRGAIYRVSACNWWQFRVEGNPHNYHEWRFRPISRRSDFESFLTEIKTPRDDVTAPETVDA